MTVQPQSAEDLIGSAGVAGAARFTFGGVKLIPHLAFALDDQFLGDCKDIATALVPVPDVVRTVTVAGDASMFARLSGCVSVQFTPDVTATLTVATTVARNNRDEHAAFRLVTARFWGNRMQGKAACPLL